MSAELVSVQNVGFHPPDGEVAPRNVVCTGRPGRLGRLRFIESELRGFGADV
jgi:hypothetical protein